MTSQISLGGVNDHDGGFVLTEETKSLTTEEVRSHVALLLATGTAVRCGSICALGSACPWGESDQGDACSSTLVPVQEFPDIPALNAFLRKKKALRVPGAPAVPLAAD